LKPSGYRHRVTFLRGHDALASQLLPRVHRVVSLLKRWLLGTHQVVTVVLPAQDGRVLKIRKATVPEAIHREIYTTLRIPAQVMTPVKTWHRQGDLVTTKTLTCWK
jgi:hypothetical protein